MKHLTLAALVTTCALADEGILGRLFPGLKENSTDLPVRSDSLVVGGALRATHLKQASQIVNSDRISKVREGLNKYLANLSEADVAKLRESRMIINIPARDTPTRDDTHTLDTPTLDTPTRREVAPAPETPVISPAAEKMISSLKKFVADKGTAAQARSNVVASNSVVASKSVATNSEDRKAKMLESLKRFASGEKPSAAEPVAAGPVAAVRAEPVAAVRAVSHENAGEHMMEALAKFAAKATPSSSSEVSSVDDKKNHMLEALKRYSGDSVVSGSTA